MILPSLPIKSTAVVYRRCPKTGRLTVYGKKLYWLDGISKPILSNGKVWQGLTIESDAKTTCQLFIEKPLKVGFKLVSLPKGSLL